MLQRVFLDRKLEIFECTRHSSVFEVLATVFLTTQLCIIFEVLIASECGLEYEVVSDVEKKIVFGV